MLIIYLFSGCTAIQRKTSLRQPHCQMLPDGKYVCYLESSGVIMRNISDTREYYRREAFFKYGIYRFCSMSPDELHISVIMQIKNVFHLYVFSTLYFYSYKEVSCTDVFPPFPSQSNSYGNEHVECAFSPDSQYIAVSTSMGQLFVVKRQGLTLYRGVIPGIVSKELELVSPRSYDFDPRFKHEVLAFCTSDWVLHAFNLDTGTLLWKKLFQMGLEIHNAWNITKTVQWYLLQDQKQRWRFYQEATAIISLFSIAPYNVYTMLWIRSRPQDSIPQSFACPLPTIPHTWRWHRQTGWYGFGSFLYSWVYRVFVGWRSFNASRPIKYTSYRCHPNWKASFCVVQLGSRHFFLWPQGDVKIAYIFMRFFQGSWKKEHHLFPIV